MQVMDLVNLGNEAERILDRSEEMRAESRWDEHMAEDGIRDLWKSLGTLFSVFLRRRGEAGREELVAESEEGLEDEDVVFE